MTEPGNQQTRPERGRTGDFTSYYQLAGIGFEFIAAILLFAGVGWLIDRWLDSSPWAIIIGVGVGFTIGLWNLIKRGMKSFKD
jgi:ATP synthase protein I